jgi:hypothetical protein
MRQNLQKAAKTPLFFTRNVVCQKKTVNFGIYLLRAMANYGNISSPA